MTDADDLALWLQRQGLEALAAKLRAHDIDLELLPHLSEDDLREAGLSLGQRRRLMLALRTGAGAGDPVPAAERRAERRRLTVLFVDLVGSTALSARLDPEDTRGVMRSFQNVVAGEIARYRGHVAKFLGDGALAYFGWPTADEDDAERAVRAALAIVAQVGQLTAPGGGPLAARAGLATGEVVVADGRGSGAEGETEIAGDPPNLAARLQNLAASGQVALAEGTRRLVAGRFEVAELGHRGLRGFPQPQPVFAVVGERSPATRFEARQVGRSSANMVGRERELALLTTAWERALGGQGNLVLLSGEAGIGKSRLVSGLEQRLESRQTLILRFQCSPFHTTTALWPVTEQIAQAAELGRARNDDERLARLRDLVAGAGSEPEAHLPILANLLGLAQADHPLARLPPAERKRRLFDTLAAQLDGLAAQRPVLVVLEDAHWSDPTTTELFARLLADLDGRPILAVVTFRPEYAPPFRSFEHASEILLQPLSAAAAGSIVADIAPDLPTALVDDIVQRADGVPLFIEEVARSIAERLAAGSAPTPPAVPVSLHDTLMARLDRLGSARGVAQVGSAIGRRFGHVLLAECIDLPRHRLELALDKLVASGLVSRHDGDGGTEYLFKHALVQDAAYHSLLHSQRRELHRRIADRLARGARAEAPELLAHHLTEAGDAAAAIAAWRTAAERAVARSANREAARHLERALGLLDALAGEARAGLELALRLQQTVPLIALHGFGSSEVADCVRRALTLADAAGDSFQRFAALRTAWNSTLMREPLPAALAMADELMRQADAAGEPVRRAVAQRARGYTLCMMGRHREALGAFDAGIELAEQVADEDFAPFGEHPGIVCRFYSAWSLALMGEAAEARSRADRALVIARRLGNPHGLAWALVCAGVAALFSGDAERVTALQQEALATARTYQLPQWIGFSTNYLGWALHVLGQRESGLRDLSVGYELVRGTGAVLNLTVMLWARADRRLAEGDVTGAAEDVAQSMAHVASHGEAIVLPGLHLLAGDVAMARGADPRRAWRDGLACALDQGSTGWVHRLECRLARHQAG